MLQLIFQVEEVVVFGSNKVDVKLGNIPGMSPAVSQLYYTNQEFFFQLKCVQIFLFLSKNICCGYSLEASCQGTFNEYMQYMFSKRIKKNNTPYLNLWTALLEMCWIF